MRSFKGQNSYVPSTTQPQIYTPSRQQYQNKIFNSTQNSKNKNRAQQIVSLHEQFEDLKKKIKQVQNKNQRIIQKIHRECNFKKKNPQTFDLLVDNTAPIIYYEKKQKSQVSQMSGMSIDESNKSDQSEYEFKQKKNVVQQRNSVQSNKNISPTMFSQSMQYTKDARQRDRDRNRDFQRDPPRIDKIQKKYSKISANNASNNRYDDHNAQSINSQEMLVENQFQQETPNLKFQMQGSHQTYSHLKEISANNSAAYNNNSGKKSMIIPSYPSSQTQMTYNGVGLTPSHNNNKILSSSSQQFSQQHIMHHHQPLMTSAFTPQQKNTSTSLHQSMFNLPLYQIQQSLKIQKQKTAYLEQQLKQKQFQILQIKKQYNKVVSQFDNWQMILQDQLDSFMQNVVKKGFFDIQKVMKKNQNRVRNLSMRIRDQYEEHKSNKLIKEHQLRRSNSRSKRDLSPVHNTSINSAISPLLPPNQHSKIPKPSNGTSTNILQIQTTNSQKQKQRQQKQRQERESKSKISDQSFKKNKQFQQIVSKYQEMINIKNSQISKLQTLIKSLNRKNDDLQLVVQKKDKQLKQITIKMQELQKLMSQMDNEVPVPIAKKRNNSPTMSGVEEKMRRISSNQSNLLEDIYHEDVVKEYKETEFQLKYLEVKQELEERDERIRELENKILGLEQKVKSAQSIKIDQRSNPGSSSNIPSPHHNSQYQQQKLIKQKVQQARRDLMYSHQQQLQIREQQILKLKQKITRIQKTMVQKDCEIISFQNKIKKLQGVNQINFKKIQEYEKLLNHYQHNNSVDLEGNQIGMMLLDKSLCYDNAENNLTSRSTNGGGESSVGGQRHKGAERSASKKNIVIARTQLENLQNQIESMSQQILILTKKIKNLQSSQKQKAYELQRIGDEFQVLSHQKHALSKQNHSLKDKITELQEKLQQIQQNNSYQNQIQQQSYQYPHQQSQNNNETDLLDPRQNLVLQKNNNSIYSQKSQTTSRIKNKSITQGRQKQRKKSELHEVVLIEQQKRDIQRQLIQQKQNNQSKRRLQQQIQSLKSKNLQLSKHLNSLKSQHLQISRNNISLKKDNQYLQDSLSDRQQKYEKYRKQYEELKVKLNEMVDLCHKKDQELKKEKQENCAKIQELEKQWYEFQEEINRNNNQHNQNLMHSSFTDHFGNRNHGNNESQLLKSSRYNISQSSLLLTSTLHNKNSQYLQQQNEYLTIKLKQAQATIQMHNMMQQKVLNQYKTNVQKLKLEIKQKTKQCDLMKKQHEIIKDSKRRLEILLQSSKNQLEENRREKERLEKEKEVLSVRQRQISQYSNKKSERSKRNINVNINEKSNSELKVEQNSQNDNQKSLDMQQFAQFNEQENNLSMMSQQQLQQMSQIQNIRSNQKPANPANLKQSQKSQFEQQERLHPYERILELQNDLKQQKDINKKLQQMQQQLFKQIRIKQQEKNELMKLIDQKNMKIQQLQEIVELKQMNVNTSHIGSNILGSHISSSNHKSSSHHNNNFKQSQNNLSQRESMHSHSSLRYSGITHNNNRQPIIGVINPSSNTLNVMGQSQLGHSQRFEIQLSETGSQMLDQSYVTNISQIFQRQQFPYQKVQLKRKQQIKLFQKTASYIKSLKDSINQKNKRIKLLQKKIQSLKNNHHGTISKELENKYEISTGMGEKQQEMNFQLDYEFESVYKDYESVQLQRKRASHNKRYKTLQHQWKLALQQNNVLSNQIQALQQQLQKAQEQQNNLLKIKDLYKDQIKKLITKNDSQVQYYQDLLAKQKKKVEQSEAVHNMETLKQLFLKTVDCIIVIQSQKSKKKREQKRKELEEYFNVFASISSIDQKRKYIIIEGIRKMSLNIVLAEQGRGSSSSKKKE